MRCMAGQWHVTKRTQDRTSSAARVESCSPASPASRVLVSQLRAVRLRQCELSELNVCAVLWYRGRNVSVDAAGNHHCNCVASATVIAGILPIKRSVRSED